MNSPFVPLLPERDAKASPRAELKTNFRPSTPLATGAAAGIGTGTGTGSTGGGSPTSAGAATGSDSDGLDPAAMAAASATQGCSAPKRREPVVELIRDGNRVSHLKITCGCGEIITIECQYDRASA